MPVLQWKELYQYWQSKMVEGRPPSRDSIDPLIDIPHLVKNLMLMDAKTFIYRLVGSEVATRHGFDMTGRKSGTSGKDPEAVSVWTDTVNYVVREMKPRILISRVGSNEVAKNVMILLPLADANGDVEMVLIGSFYNEHFKPGTQVDGMTVSEMPL